MINILIVENEALERKVLKKFINAFEGSANIFECSSSFEANEIVKKENIHLAFIDVKIEGQNGLELAEEILSYKKETIIIIISGYMNSEYGEKAREIGCREYFKKPVRQETIIEALEKHLKGDFLERENQKLLYSDLIQAIINKDLKDSKRFLEEYLLILEQNLTRQKATFLEEREEYRLLAVVIFRDLEKLNSDNSNRISAKIMPKLQNAKTRYQLKGCLFEILELIFEVIVTEKPDLSHNEMTRIVNYIEKNYMKKLSLEDVANYSNLSSFYLSKLFKRHAGENLVEYITNLKIEKAKDLLLNTDMPIIDVALSLSFNEAGYFSRVFKNKTGVSPSNFRKGLER